MHYAWIVLGASAGAIAGSFLGTLVIRWERGDSIVDGRSRCDHCGARIGVLALVPIAGFIALAGRCPSCGGTIDRRHLAVETGCVIIGAIALGVRPGLEGASGALFGWLLMALALLDLRNFWLPDRLVAPLAAAGIGVGVLLVPPSLEDRLIGAVAGFLALTAVAWGYQRFRGRTGLGAGDAKLFGAIGAWLGWRALPFVLLLAALAGLFWCMVQAALGRGMTLNDRLPLGTLLALAAWPIWLVGP